MLNSQTYVTSQTEPTRRRSQTNGSDAYAEVDIEGAKELLAGATPTIRLMYNINNPNRVAAFEAIQASATEAGFVIEDIGREDWSAQLGERHLRRCRSSAGSRPVSATSTIPQIFASDGGIELHQSPTIPEVDELAAEIQVMTDPADVEEAPHPGRPAPLRGLLRPADVPEPGVEAHTDRISGVTFMANQTGPIWNFWEWTAVDAAE